MIELEQIKTTDQLGALRGQLNTAFTEIQSDQPFVGRVVNPSVQLYYGNTLVGSITASALTSYYLCALCLPESNGVYVAEVWGMLGLKNTTGTAITYNSAQIDVPSVSLGTRTANISTFVSPKHIGLSGTDSTMIYGHPACLRTGSSSGATTMYSALVQHDNTCDIILNTGSTTIRLPFGADETHYLYL